MAKLNINPGQGYTPIVPASQYDVGRELVFTIYDGSSPASIPSGTIATMVGTKPSGLGFTQQGTVSGNTVTVITTATMTEEGGHIPAELRLTYSGNNIGTANFIFGVEASPHPEDVTDGDAETAKDLMTRANEAVAAAATAAAAATESAEAAEAAAEAISQAGIDTTGATAGQVPTANGDGSWSWQDQQGGGGSTSDDISNESTVNGSTVTDALETLSDEIASEASTRQSAVSGVQSAVTSEASTRADADASLRSAIDALVSPEGESVVVDSSLSISGAAADAEATGEIKDSLNYVWNTTKLTNASSGAKIFLYPITASKTYYFKNLSANSVGLRTCTSDGTQVELIQNGIASGNEVVFTATTDADYVRLYSGSAGAVVSVKTTGQILDDFFGNVNSEIGDVDDQLKLIQSYDWASGYCATNGEVVTHATRKISQLLICPANASVTYIAEKHSGVYGISFWDIDKQFISGVAYTGDDAENTVTSPPNTMYARLSTTPTLLDDTYLSYNGTSLTAIGDAIGAIDERFDRYIKFVTTGTTRSNQYTDISDMISAKVEDDAYEIALFYDGQNTGWKKSISNIQSYENATHLQLRKADNSTMAAGSALNVATAIRKTGVVQFGDLAGQTGYVDGDDGSDSNSGTSWADAFATIQKAIDSGYTDVKVKPGTYTSGITMASMQKVNIFCDKSFDSFDATSSPDNTKVVIDCDNTLVNGVSMQSCIDCSLTDIEVKNATGNGFDIRACSGKMLFDGCISHDIPNGQGFYLLNTNASFVNCGVYNIGTIGGGEHHDGFNIHGTGTTSFKNCWGNTCEDDGISHHDACHGYIDGGEWYNCGKGGVASPTHGAQIDVMNAYSHDNNYGLYAENSTAALAKTSNISNCVFKNNSVYDISTLNNTLNIWNCIYDTINHSGTGNNNVIS